VVVDDGNPVRLAELRGVETPARRQTTVDDEVESLEGLGWLGQVERHLANVDFRHLVPAVTQFGEQELLVEADTGVEDA